MTIKPTSFIRPVSASFVSLLLTIGLNNVAMADNSAALKDAIPTNNTLAEAQVAATTEAEVSASGEADFKKLDANKDGRISLKEAVKDKSLTTYFDAADMNRDGMVSADEYTNYKSAASATGIENPASSTN